MFLMSHWFLEARKHETAFQHYWSKQLLIFIHGSLLWAGDMKHCICGGEADVHCLGQFCAYNEKLLLEEIEKEN